MVWDVWTADGQSTKQTNDTKNKPLCFKYSKTHRFHCVLENRREFGEHFVLRLDQFLPRRPREFLYLLLPVAAASLQIGGFIH